MINLLIYLILGCIAFVVYDIKRTKKGTENNTFIGRESDQVIQVISGRFRLIEK